MIDVDAIFRNHTNQLIDSILGKQANKPLPVTKEEFAHNNTEIIELENVDMIQWEIYDANFNVGRSSVTDTEKAIQQFDQGQEMDVDEEYDEDDPELRGNARRDDNDEDQKETKWITWHGSLGPQTHSHPAIPLQLLLLLLPWCDAYIFHIYALSTNFYNFKKHNAYHIIQCDSNHLLLCTFDRKSWKLIN